MGAPFILIAALVGVFLTRKEHKTVASGEKPEAALVSYFAQWTTASRRKRAQPDTCLS